MQRRFRAAFAWKARPALRPAAEPQSLAAAGGPIYSRHRAPCWECRMPWSGRRRRIGASRGRRRRFQPHRPCRAGRRKAARPSSGRRTRGPVTATRSGTPRWGRPRGLPGTSGRSCGKRGQVPSHHGRSAAGGNIPVGLQATAPFGPALADPPQHEGRRDPAQLVLGLGEDQGDLVVVGANDQRRVGTDAETDGFQGWPGDQFAVRDRAQKRYRCRPTRAAFSRAGPSASPPSFESPAGLSRQRIQNPQGWVPRRPPRPSCGQTPGPSAQSHLRPRRWNGKRR